MSRHCHQRIAPTSPAHHPEGVTVGTSPADTSVHMGSRTEWEAPGWLEYERISNSFLDMIAELAVQLPRGRGGEAGVAIRGPLHGGPDAVAVAQPDVVAHADLVAVVEDRGPGQGQ